MCIGIPMQVITVEPGFAFVSGRGETRRVKTSLIEQCEPGQWLLVFLDDARELISAERAAEVNATLDLLMSALGHGGSETSPDEPGFSLPSGMDVYAIQQMTQS
jgi:hydrogenase expression/formation protein HypC